MFKLVKMDNCITRTIKNFIRHTPFQPVHMGCHIREKYFFKYLKTLPCASLQEVLDAGCGPGEYTRKLAVVYPHMKITGYDVKEFASWDKSPGNVQFKQQDLLQFMEESHYDFCLCIDVLEHIRGNRQVLENIYRSLKPSGYFYLHMPNRDQRRIFPPAFFKEFERWEGREHVGEHYTLEEIEGILKSIGFNIVNAGYTFAFFGKLAWELDRLTDAISPLKILLMPALKAFAHFESWLPKHIGNGILVLSMKL